MILAHPFKFGHLGALLSALDVSQRLGNVNATPLESRSRQNPPQLQGRNGHKSGVLGAMTKWFMSFSAVGYGQRDDCRISTKLCEGTLKEPAALVSCVLPPNITPEQDPALWCCIFYSVISDNGSFRILVGCTLNSGTRPVPHGRIDALGLF